MNVLPEPSMTEEEGDDLEKEWSDEEGEDELHEVGQSEDSS